MNKDQNALMNMLKNQIKRKVFKIIINFVVANIIPITIFLLIIIIVSSANNLLGKVNGVFSQKQIAQYGDSIENINTFNGNSANEEVKQYYNLLLSDYPEETWQEMGLSKKALKVIMDAEDRSIKQDVVIRLAYKFYEHITKKSLNSSKKQVTEKTTYPTFNVTLPYYDITYLYRCPWQLMYSFSSFLDDSDQVEKLSFLDKILQQFTSEEDRKAEKLRIIGEALQPIYEYVDELSAFETNSNIDGESLFTMASSLKYADYNNIDYYEYYVKSYKSGGGFTRITEQNTDKYVPNLLVKRVETYCKIYEFTYEKVPYAYTERYNEDTKSVTIQRTINYSGYNWQLKETKVIDNSQKLLNILEKFEIEPINLLFMARQIEDLPGGSETALDLKDVYYTWLNGKQEFGANGHLNYDEVGNQGGGVYTGELEYLEGGRELPYYNQHDGWGMYGNYTVAACGCGPTSMAMVVAGLIGDGSVTPASVAQWGYAHGTQAPGGGSYWTLFSKVADKYGLSCKQISKRDPQSIINELAAGNPVIVSMGPGHFTTGGHFIVLRGITEDGQVLVSDPNSRSKSKAWDFSIIMNECSRNGDSPFFAISR